MAGPFENGNEVSCSKKGRKISSPAVLLLASEERFYFMGLIS